MQDNIEDCAKRRLTERVDLETAISILRARGYDVEEMLTEMVRLFYVDLDEFNELVRAA
ncbi:hypothetical protein [Arvimicrobium flavum]|uniref:hypothetical protein n=1 Tax=Arvimicrobium flavum TaxID=3393320 RepID=UPI00237BE728|nr:hypothetical protein [Mesorhizobium shangrilense]